MGSRKTWSAHIAVLLILSSLLPVRSSAQTSESVDAPLPDVILARIPEPYKGPAKNLTANDRVRGFLSKDSDEQLATWVIWNLSLKANGPDFLLAQLEKEQSQKLRSDIIDSLGEYWRLHPQTQQPLEHAAAADPDANVSLQALNLLLSIRMGAVNELLKTRLSAAKGSSDLAAVAKLGAEEEQWFNLQHRVMLPTFLRAAPALFSVVPTNKSIRVLAFGDFGTGSPEQKKLATAMIEYNKKNRFDFGVTLGDNFYDAGMASTKDPRWRTQWEDLYGSLGIRFYPTFGNHDYGQPDSAVAELLYSEKSPDWRFPAAYYTFTAGAVQFFAIDTINLSTPELEWLDQELSKSTSAWKVVYGHYHIYSATRGDNKELIEHLLPILKKNHVEVYLNGHDHNLQEVRADGGVHFFVSGGGGAELYDIKPYDKSVFKQKVNGFTVLEADAKHFKVSFIGIDGKELYENTLVKDESGIVSDLKGQAVATRAPLAIPVSLFKVAFCGPLQRFSEPSFREPEEASCAPDTVQ